MSRHTVMVHGADDVEPGPIYTALFDEGQLLVPGVHCPHCSEELAVKGFLGCVVEKTHDTFVAVYCVACEHHVGTARYELPSIFGREEDLTILGGRARVYGASRQGTHGDEAAGQYDRERAVMRAKQGS